MGSPFESMDEVGACNGDMRNSEGLAFVFHLNVIAFDPQEPALKRLQRVDWSEGLEFYFFARESYEIAELH